MQGYQAGAAIKGFAHEVAGQTPELSCAQLMIWVSYLRTALQSHLVQGQMSWLQSEVACPLRMLVWH